MRPEARAHAVGLAAAVVAVPLTLGGVLALNRASAAPPPGGGPRDVAFAVAPPPRARPPRAEPRAEPPRAPRGGPRPALPPAPALGPELSGVDLGLGDLALTPLDAVAGDALGDVGAVVHTEATVDTRPTPRETTTIDVPADARARNLAGRVVLSLRIDAAGAVRAAKVVEADPPGVFDAAVLAAVRGWTFAPATYHGQPVEVWATLPVEFQP